MYYTYINWTLLLDIPVSQALIHNLQVYQELVEFVSHY